MKKFFTTGLVAILPLALTTVVLYFVISFLWNNIGGPISEAVTWGLTKITGKPVAELQKDDLYSWFFPYGPPVLGFSIAIVLTFVIGFFVATFFGKKLYQLFEGMLKRMPVVRVIYPYARQFTDFFFSTDEKMDFKHAVAIPFPMQGVYSIAFVTGAGIKALSEATRKTMICVFVPTSPTPISGYVCYLPREEIIPLPISVEEAMRILITCGVVHPQHQLPPPEGAEPPSPHFPVPESLARALTEAPSKPKS